MGINIGDGNKIKNSTIAEKIEGSSSSEKKIFMIKFFGKIADKL